MRKGPKLSFCPFMLLLPLNITILTFFICIFVEIDKLRDSALQMCFIQLFFESFAAKIGNSYEQVHQNGNFDLFWWFLYDF